MLEKNLTSKRKAFVNLCTNEYIASDGETRILVYKIQIRFEEQVFSDIAKSSPQVWHTGGFVNDNIVGGKNITFGGNIC